MERTEHSNSAGYGLRREALSPMETLAQSVSTIAPTTTPVATIPLVCALAGNGTWFVYVLATVAILLVAWCVGRFARYSASPGSLYTYASMILPPWMGAITAWSLLLAYVATGSSVIGGFYHYGNIMLRDATGRGTSAVLLAVIVTGISMWIAWRDVKISARLMLWIEAASLAVILVVVVLVLARHGLHLDWTQLQLSGVNSSGLRLGLVRERDNARRRGAQSIEDDSPRRDPELPSCGSDLYRLRLCRSARLSHGGPRSGNQPRSHARAGSCGRRAGFGTAD
jgi:Amino acid permease